MNRLPPFLVAALLVGVFALPDARAADAPGAAVPPAAAPRGLAPAIELEPRALNILKGASARLAAAKTMSFKAIASEESPSRLGPPLAYYTASEVTLQRPDKLRVLSSGGGPSSEFFYDGKTMTAYSPDDNMVATASAPATVDAMLAAAYANAQIYFPFEDLLVTDPYKDIADGLRVAFYVGTASVRGWDEDLHRRLRQRRRVRAGVDRCRRPVAASTAGRVPQRPAAVAACRRSHELETRRCRSRRTPSRHPRSRGRRYRSLSAARKPCRRHRARRRPRSTDARRSR